MPETVARPAIRVTGRWRCATARRTIFSIAHSAPAAQELT